MADRHERLERSLWQVAGVREHHGSYTASPRPYYVQNPSAHTSARHGSASQPARTRRGSFSLPENFRVALGRAAEALGSYGALHRRVAHIDNCVLQGGCDSRAAIPSGIVSRHPNPGSHPATRSEHDQKAVNGKGSTSYQRCRNHYPTTYCVYLVQ